MGRPNVNWIIGGITDSERIYSTKIVKAGIPFAQQVIEPEMKYIIKFNFNLGGESVTIPEDCILEFQGGSLINGTLVGNHTQIYSEKCAIFSNITIDEEVEDEGWIVPEITTAWFKEAGSVDDVLKEVLKLCSNKVYNEVTIEPGDYWVNVPEGEDISTTLSLKSNTKYILLGNIRTRGHDYPHVIGRDENDKAVNGKSKYTIGISRKSNVTICGSGAIYGEREFHDFSNRESSHESNHVIVINKSKNVLIEGISIYDATGDGIDSAHGVDGESDGIVIRNFAIDNCRRQGITAGGTNVTIENGRITNIGGDNGTLPEAAIDIEISKATEGEDPHSNKRCSIKNLYIENCYQGILVTSSTAVSSMVCGIINIENVEAYNVGRGIGIGRAAFNVHVSSSRFTIVPRRTPGIWPVEYYDTQSYNLNSLQGWTSIIEGCSFTMEGDIPEWAEQEFNMLSTWYYSLIHYMSVTGSYFNCPYINMGTFAPRFLFTGNTVISNKFACKGLDDKTERRTMNRAKISNNNIETNYIDLDVALFNDNYVTLNGPMDVGTESVIHDNRITFDVNKYDFVNEYGDSGETLKYLFKLQRGTNIHHNIIQVVVPNSGNAVDAVFYHDSSDIDYRNANWITDNRFTASFGYDDLVFGEYSPRDIVYNNFITNDGMEKDTNHPYSATLSTGMALKPNALLFPSASGQTFSPISESNDIVGEKTYANQRHKPIPNILFYTGEEIEERETLTPLDLRKVWTKDVVVDLRYSLNFSTDLIVGNPVYLVANYSNSSEDYSFKWCVDPIYCQAISTNTPGKIYIYLGIAVGAKEVFLAEENHMWVYDENGLIKLFV